MTTSPIDALIAWYASLPVSHRRDIAALVASATPGFQSLDVWTATDLPGEFIVAMQRLRNNRYQEVGLALSLRANIEFFIVSRRSTWGAWRRAEEALQDAAQLENSEAGAFELASLHLRAEQWIKTCAKWQILRETALSDEILNSHLAPS